MGSALGRSAQEYYDCYVWIGGVWVPGKLLLPWEECKAKNEAQVKIQNGMVLRLNMTTERDRIKPRETESPVDSTASSLKNDPDTVVKSSKRLRFKRLLSLGSFRNGSGHGNGKGASIKSRRLQGSYHAADPPSLSTEDMDQVSDPSPGAVAEPLNREEPVGEITPTLPRRTRKPDGIHIGMAVICQDFFVSKYTGYELAKWREAEIVNLEPSSVDVIATVSFNGWQSKHDVKLSLKDEWNRLALPGTLSDEQMLNGTPLEGDQSYQSYGVFAVAPTVDGSRRGKENVSQVIDLSEDDTQLGWQPQPSRSESFGYSRKESRSMGTNEWHDSQGSSSSSNRKPGSATHRDQHTYTSSRRYDNTSDEVLRESDLAGRLHIQQNPVARSGSQEQYYIRPGHESRAPIDQPHRISNSMNEEGTYSGYNGHAPAPRRSTSSNRLNYENTYNNHYRDSSGGSSISVSKRERDMQRRGQQPSPMAVSGEGSSLARAGNFYTSDDAFRIAMKRKGLAIVDVEPDGNCLFRSVSHQIYGHADNHKDVRRACVEHMKRYRERFQTFVAEDFSEYLKRMKQQCVWGDDVEIRALEELFDRPIEIYVPDREDLKPMKTDFEASCVGDGELVDAVPMKLSYHGQSHYNSVWDMRQEYPLQPRKSNTILQQRVLQHNEQPSPQSGAEGREI